MVIKQHKDITITELMDIARTKQVAWPKYSFDSHLNWMDKVLTPDTWHYMYYVDGVLEAYLNIFNIDVEIDGLPAQINGFGNLCALHNGRAYGSLLMKKSLNRINNALSFCIYDKVSYYRSFGWEFVHRSMVEMPNVDTEQLRIMTYNMKFLKLKYLGEKF